MCSYGKNHVLLSDDSTAFLVDVSAYRRLIGRLIYLTLTRPDFSYSVHVLAQLMHSPRESHWHATLKLIKYFHGKADQGFFFSSADDLSITAYYDADWASCPTSRLSLTGYLFLLVIPL